MPDETTTTTEAPVTKKAKKARKAKPRKAVKASNGVKLLKPHRQVLRQLHKGGAMTRRKIADLAGRVDDLYNGRIANETKTYEFLEKQGLIKTKEIDDDGVTVTVNIITAAGKKAYDAAK